MEIVLNLKNHCIETATKREYERSIQNYFKDSSLERFMLEARIEALKFFLEKADFMRLRSIYPELDGSLELSLTLKVPEDFQKLKIILNDKILKPEWKKT
jgi:hypothetical protein